MPEQEEAIQTAKRTLKDIGELYWDTPENMSTASLKCQQSAAAALVDIAESLRIIAANMPREV